MLVASIGLFHLEIHRIIKGVIEYSSTLLTGFAPIIGLPSTKPAAARSSSSLVNKDSMFIKKIFPCDILFISDCCHIL